MEGKVWGGVRELSKRFEGLGLTFDRCLIQFIFIWRGRGLLEGVGRRGGGGRADGGILQTVAKRRGGVSHIKRGVKLFVIEITLVWLL